jgi:ribonuclease Z
VVDGLIAFLRPDIGYRIDHHDDLSWEPPVEVAEAVEGVVFDEGGVRVVAAPTDHRPVHPTVGYRVEHDGTSVVIAGDTVPCEGLGFVRKPSACITSASRACSALSSCAIPAVSSP